MHIRESSESTTLRQGIRMFTTVALAPDGEIVGHTRIAVPDESDDPEHAHQWATLVTAKHRGHRLGLAIKARKHLELQRAMPDLDRTMNTWNDPDNHYMISTNEALGYLPVDVYEEFQGDL